MMVERMAPSGQPGSAGRANPVLLLGIGILLLGAGFLLSRSFGTVEPLKVDGPGSAPASRPESRGAVAPKIAQERPGKPPVETDPSKIAGMLRLPNGTAVPPLNGVKNPPPLQWKAKRPWSDIIGTRIVEYPDRSPVEWYVHADGSQSTTVMLKQERQGKSWWEPFTLVGYATESNGVPEAISLDGQQTSRPGAGIGIAPGK